MGKVLAEELLGFGFDVTLSELFVGDSLYMGISMEAAFMVFQVLR